MDIPQAQEMAKRMKLMLPPQILEAEAGGGDPQSQLQAAQAKVQALTMQLQQATGLLKQQHDIIETKTVETQGRVQIEQLKGQTQTDIEKLKIAAQILIAQINTKSQEQQTRDSETNDVWQALHDTAHETAQMGQQLQAQAQQQAAGAQADQQSQQSDQAHELGMQAATGAQQQNAQQLAATQENNQQ